MRRCVYFRVYLQVLLASSRGYSSPTCPCDLSGDAALHGSIGNLYTFSLVLELCESRDFVLLSILAYCEKGLFIDYRIVERLGVRCYRLPRPTVHNYRSPAHSHYGLSQSGLGTRLLQDFGLLKLHEEAASVRYSETLLPCVRRCRRV
ncbi:hypothetical protein DPMN_150535 [Dreissena polymorpha]|uniref:Uncharacterized protein n=1 Tax=Dreissena polymorpha TaxID=45954 RepID=A0A9D4FDH5_DREPO|nr:hypothetical protein DPMN_150535 [Dreissena polymorpha]